MANQVQSVDYWPAWLALFPQAAPEVSQQYFQELIRLYQSRGRFYHNLSHIAALLGHLKQAPEVNNPGLVQYAIWYHDAIYQPLRKDNELRSAQLALKALPELGVVSESAQQVGHWIEYTAHHLQVPQGQDSDLDLFLDLDLSILGAPAEIYQAYTQAIRREYRLVPGPLYRRRRKQFVETFLQTAILFRTPWAHQKWDAQARANLRWELSALSSKC